MPPVKNETHVVVRLLNRDFEVPLTGFAVHAFDLDVKPEPQDLAFATSDVDGLATLVYTPSHKAPVDCEGHEATQHLRLHILDLESKEIHQTEVHANPKETLEVRVPVPVASGPDSLTEINKKLEPHLPEELINALAARGIGTLEHIRKLGGISHLKEQLKIDQQAVKALEAHAKRAS
jgi:hypothetical protein